MASDALQGAVARVIAVVGLQTGRSRRPFGTNHPKHPALSYSRSAARSARQKRSPRECRDIFRF